MESRKRQSVWDDEYQPMSQINITPMVDVMLVLLIIFMVAAPMLTQGVNVDLPDANAPQIRQQTEPLVISIKRMVMCICRIIRLICSRLHQELLRCVKLNPTCLFLFVEMPKQRMGM